MHSSNIYNNTCQIDGQMGMAVTYLETESLRCVNCDVYDWKQVKKKVVVVVTVAGH